jgi:hypothetical protein
MLLIVFIIQTQSKGFIVELAINILILVDHRALIVPLVGLVGLAIILLVLYVNSPLVQRLISIDEDSSTAERTALIQDSFQ